MLQSPWQLALARPRLQPPTRSADQQPFAATRRPQLRRSIAYCFERRLCLDDFVSGQQADGGKLIAEAVGERLRDVQLGHQLGDRRDGAQRNVPLHLLLSMDIQLYRRTGGITTMTPIIQISVAQTCCAGKMGQEERMAKRTSCISAMGFAKRSPVAALLAVCSEKS